MNDGLGDRWLELDLGALRPHSSAEQAARFIDRVAPLLSAATGWRGVILNCGWIADLILEWNGDLTQPLPFDSRRLSHWHGATYGTLAETVAALKRAAAAKGIAELRVGVLTVACGRFLFPDDNALYDVPGRFIARHPEAYDPIQGEYQMPGLRLHATLAGDTHRYAAFPTGLPAGVSWAEVFAAQWGRVAATLGFDTLLLRDGFPPSDSKQPEAACARFCDLIRRIKATAPQALLMGYSGAARSLAGRSSGIRLEAFAEAGLDAWITQTWGGAWQDWWNSQRAGWTFQLTHLLADRMALAGTRCRHYHLVETWDGFEPWDTLHWTPGKLEWAIHAFSHTAWLENGRPRLADGAYVSWANDPRGELLSEGDVFWVNAWMDAAATSARAMERVRGPVLVLDRAADYSAVNDWIDDHVALLMLWGVPCLAATHADDLHGGEAWLVPSCIPWNESREAALLSELRGGRPALVVGSPGTLPARLAEELGVGSGPAAGVGYRALAGANLGPRAIGHFAAGPVLQARGGRTLLRANGDAALVAAPALPALTWLPCVPLAPGHGTMNRNQYGGFDAFAATASAFLELLAARGAAAIRPLERHQACAAHAWDCDGKTQWLLGNIAPLQVADARWPRRVAWPDGSSAEVPAEGFLRTAR